MHENRKSRFRWSLVFDTPGKQYNGSSLGHGEKLSEMLQCQTGKRFSSLKKTGTFHAKHVEMQSQHEVVPNHVGDCMTVRRVAKVFWAIWRMQRFFLVKTWHIRVRVGQEKNHDTFVWPGQWSSCATRFAADGELCFWGAVFCFGQTGKSMDVSGYL